MPQKRLFSLLFPILFLAPQLFGQALFNKPVRVLGDPNFIGTASNPLQFTSDGPNGVEGRELNFPLAIALDKSVSPPNVYIADSGNHRVLGFRYTSQLTPGAPADVILGQVDAFSNLAQGGANRATGMNLPSGLAVDSSGNLYVADSGNNRILRYPRPLSQPGGFSFPDMVIGQTSLSGKSPNAGGLSATSLSLLTGTVGRVGLAFDSAGNLWVADSTNNRILRYPSSALVAGQNAPAADLVLGQPDFTTAAATTARTNKSSLVRPQGIAFDSAGRLYVSDLAFRVLVYPAEVVTNAAAVRILGVDNTTSPATQVQINGALGVAVTDTGVIVTDTGNNRLLVFPPFDQFQTEAAQFSPSASSVIGQPSFIVGRSNSGNPEASATSFFAPSDAVSSGSELFVADTQNNRVVVIPVTGNSVAGGATRVIGQLDLTYNGVNLVEGKAFHFASAGVSGSAVLDQSSPTTRLYVADALNHRILGFSDFRKLKKGQPADLVIGQPDFSRNVANYPGTGTSPNAQGLRFPTGLTVDSAGNLYVADTGNSRILRFPAPFASGKTALQSADLVIGQQSFTTVVTDATDRTMNAPFGLTFSVDGANASSAAGFLIVADSQNHRVLFFPKPFTSGMSATKVLGQLNLNSNATSDDAQRFAFPRSVAVDAQDRVIVADTGNGRIQIFDRAANVSNFATRTLSLELADPGYVTSAAKGFWAAAAGDNALVHYPPVDQLIINPSPDAAVPAVSPRSVFADSFSNLVVADGANRVLYFAPRVSVISAANYSSRAVTAGEIVSVFPVGATATVGAETGAFTTLPLPVILGDTQVLVNGTAAPLFFASPGQVNLVLPNGLSAGGTAELQVVRESTGQVYGGAELSLASSSPGLFTSNASGSGQVAAINVQDQTVNSPANGVARGQFISLYLTGLGPVANAPADGTAPSGLTPAAELPQILLGSSTTFLPSANITYSGLAPGLVGVWQINLLIPATAQTGNVPIRIFQNSIPSTEPGGAVPANTTITIK